jgi:hypothetical protein
MSASDALSPAKRALLERRLRERRGASTITRRGGTAPAPLSFAQERMWFLQQWEPQAPTFNGARAIALGGPLDVDALRRAFAIVLERHESLRTVVIPGPEPLQGLLDGGSFELEVLAADDDVAAQLTALAREPFDLTRDLMLRATLIELGADRHVLLIRMHHIAADAHCDGILFAELGECYDALRAGRDPRLAELPIQYADYAVWEREWLTGEVLARHLAYWAGALEGAPPLLRLPTDRPRPAVQHHDGAHHPLEFAAPLGARLAELGREESATFFIAMLAAFACFLYRLSGEADIVVGSPIANRARSELVNLLGFLTNTIALRTRLGGNPTFREVLRRARESALGAYEHHALPFEKVVEAVGPRRDPGYNPLFQVNFRAQAAPRPSLVLTGVVAEPISVDIGFSRFDLALEVELRDGGISGYFEYNQELFDPQTMVGFVGDLGALIEQAVDDPDAPILSLRMSGGARRRSGGPPLRRRPTPHGSGR